MLVTVCKILGSFGVLNVLCIFFLDLLYHLVTMKASSCPNTKVLTKTNGACSCGVGPVSQRVAGPSKNWRASPPKVGAGHRAHLGGVFSWVSARHVSLYTIINGPPLTPRRDG